MIFQSMLNSVYNKSQMMVPSWLMFIGPLIKSAESLHSVQLSQHFLLIMDCPHLVSCSMRQMFHVAQGEREKKKKESGSWGMIVLVLESTACSKYTRLTLQDVNMTVHLRLTSRAYIIHDHIVTFNMTLCVYEIEAKSLLTKDWCKAF